MMDWATRPSGNVINIPDDVRRQMMNPKFYPIQFAQLSKPLAAPHIPEVTLPSSNSGAWKYDHCELQSGGQTVFPFTRSRQDSFVLTAQCISLRHLFPRSAVRARARPKGLPRHGAGVVPRGRKAFSNARDGGTRGLTTVPCRRRQPAMPSLLGNPSLTSRIGFRLERRRSGRFNAAPRRKLAPAGTSASLSLSVNVTTIMVTELFRLFASGIAEQNVVDQPRTPDHRRDRD